MSLSNFEKCFADECKKGLIDIKLAINAGKGITNDAVQEELIAAEASIASGFLRNAPIATSTTPADISAILQNSRVQIATV